MNEGARTNRTGNLMRMLDGDRNRYVALTALPSPEQLSEMLSGISEVLSSTDDVSSASAAEGAGSVVVPPPVSVLR